MSVSSQQNVTITDGAVAQGVQPWGRRQADMTPSLGDLVFKQSCHWALSTWQAPFSVFHETAD